VKGLCLAGPSKSGETSRFGFRDPVAGGVKCGPHGARKARRSRGQEPVQGSGSRPKSTREVCGGSSQNYRLRATKPRSEARRAETRSGRTEKL
jgi:hypothetical protein